MSFLSIISKYYFNYLSRVYIMLLVFFVVLVWIKVFGLCNFSFDSVLCTSHLTPTFPIPLYKTFFGMGFFNLEP